MAYFPYVSADNISINGKSSKMTDTGPYLPLSEAALFCGYSEKYFRRLAKEYEIPRYGPHKNRFKAMDLHEFMNNPRAFQSPRRRMSRQGWTPVQV